MYFIMTFDALFRNNLCVYKQTSFHSNLKIINVFGKENKAYKVHDILTKKLFFSVRLIGIH